MLLKKGAMWQLLGTIRNQGLGINDYELWVKENNLGIMDQGLGIRDSLQENGFKVMRRRIKH